MIIQFHTPKGIVEVDTETVTDAGLAKLNITREDLQELVLRDLTAEFDTLVFKLEEKGVIAEEDLIRPL